MSCSYSEAMSRAVKNVMCATTFQMSHPSKISLKPDCAFSLPAGKKFSCPGATEACKGCYATKRRHMFRPVQEAFAKNWLLLRKCERYNKTDTAVSMILSKIRKDAKIMRIHESGDWHSQWSIGMWAKVIKARPDVKFWGYTRSFMLDFSSILKQPNFTLWASTDKFNLPAAKKFVRKYKRHGVKHAYGPWNKDESCPPNSFTCPVTTHKMEIEGACELCKLCIERGKTNKHVVFLAH